MASTNSRPTALVFLAVLLLAFVEIRAFSIPTNTRIRAYTTTSSRSTMSMKTEKPSPTLQVGSGRTQLRSQDDDSSEVEEDTSSAWLLTLVFPLLFVYISNQWSRSSLYYLVNFSEDADPFRAMNVDIGFSEGQYGLLASVVFTSLFAIASLGAGIASDRYNRKVLTVVAAIGWSIAALGTSLSSTYSEVVFWRVAMGLACAFSTPTAYTLINQGVPKDRISFATSIYGSGVAFGGGLASLSILLDTEYGWQHAMQVISVFGFGSALLSALLLPDDPKAAALPQTMTEENPTKDESAFLDDVTQAFSTTRVKWLYLGSFLRFCSGLCIGVWSAPYFRMIFPDNATDYAVAQALITAVAGSSSGLLGGAAADWLFANAKEDAVGQRLWVPVVGSTLAAPMWYLAIHSDQSFQTAMTWLGMEYLVAECWFGPTISSLQATVGTKIGGTAQGLFTLTGAIANFAPTLIGFLYGQATGVDASNPELVDLLAAGVCFGYLSSAFCFAMSAQASPPDLAKIKQA